MTDTKNTQNADTPQGLAFAVSAYFLWGFLPLYLKAIGHIPAIEVVAHRVIWSIPVAGLLLIILKRTSDLKEALRSPKTLGMASLTALFISSNWAIYVYAIATDRALDGALGYYINPLFSMLLGAVLLGERLNRAQGVAVALAAIAVLVIFVSAARPPWIPIGLMTTWGFYAFCKKSLPIGPNQGFLLEVLILAFAALPYLIYLSSTGQAHLFATTSDTLFLMGCGVVTSVPLILYANGAKLLKLTTIAMLQYIAPTMILLQAVFLFKEEVDVGRMIAFPLIWLGLIIYSVSMLREMRRA